MAVFPMELLIIINIYQQVVTVFGRWEYIVNVAKFTGTKGIKSFCDVVKFRFQKGDAIAIVSP